MKNFNYFILSVFLLFISCSEPAGIDEAISVDSGEGYYLGVILDSNQRIHSRSDSLYMEFLGVYYLSECVLDDFYSRSVAGVENHIEVVMPFGGTLAPECPIQNGIQGVEWWMDPTEFPSEDTLVVFGQSQYLLDDSNRVIGARQGLTPLDTIELRWGEHRVQDFEIKIDSFAQIEDEYKSKSLQRVLMKDSTAKFYLEISNSTCPKEYVNEECTPVDDTSWTTIFSQRDQIDDSTFNQIEIDTVKWIINKKCSNSADYCGDVEQSSFVRAILDTTLQLRTYETWLIEKLNPCSVFNTLNSAFGSQTAESNPGFPNLGSFRFERSLFDLDESQEMCLPSQHFYGYSFTNDSLVFDQTQLESLWDLR